MEVSLTKKLCESLEEITLGGGGVRNYNEGHVLEGVSESHACPEVQIPCVNDGAVGSLGDNGGASIGYLIAEIEEGGPAHRHSQGSGASLCRRKERDLSVERRGGWGVDLGVRVGYLDFLSVFLWEVELIDQKADLIQGVAAANRGQHSVNGVHEELRGLLIDWVGANLGPCSADELRKT